MLNICSKYLIRGSIVTTLGITGLISWLSYSSSHQQIPIASFSTSPSERSAIARAEDLLLEKHVKHSEIERFSVPLTPRPHHRLHSLHAPSNGSPLMIHTIKATRPSSKDRPAKPVLVLVHGWGSGSALWCKNLDALTNYFDVYCCDLLGFGQSSRPQFTGSSPEDARDFWLNAFEAWKDQILPEGQSFALLGHSLGGYLAASYCIQTNDKQIEALYLAAPVGISPWIFSIDSWQKKLLSSLIWDLGITPQGILRSFRSYGPSLWNNLGEKSGYRELDEDCWSYLGHSQILPGSGDIAFMKLLTRTGWGDPLLPSLDRITVPTRLIYGERDYVRPDFGPTAVKHMTNSPLADYTIIPDIGHHLYWKQSNHFTKLIINFHQKIAKSNSSKEHPIIS